MLIKLGPVEFTVQPFNTHETESSAATDYARKEVVGARRPLEHMGEGEETLHLSGKLFPKHQGGLEDMAKLHAARQSGQPQYVMRGDGKPLGWYVIEQVDERASYLSRDGVGQQVEFTVYLVRAPIPSALGGIGSIFDLFEMLFQS